MDKADNEEIIDKICDYAKEYQIKDLLQEYLKRIILAKPKDPIAFLINEIKTNPVQITVSKNLLEQE